MSKVVLEKVFINVGKKIAFVKEHPAFITDVCYAAM